MSTLSVSSIQNVISLSGAGFESIGATANAANVNAAAANLIASAAFANATGTLNGSFTANGTVSDSLGNLRDVPVNSQTSAYVLQESDQGKLVSITSGGITVPNAVFSAGDNISIYNASFSNQTISYASGVTCYLVGTANTTSKTLAQRGIATVICVAANTFVITGGGLT